MLPYSSKQAGSLLNRQLLLACRRNIICVSPPQRSVLVRYQNTSSDSRDSSDPGEPNDHPSDQSSDHPRDHPREHHSNNHKDHTTSNVNTRLRRNKWRNHSGLKKLKFELDVTTLGRPGEVLVVRERGKRRFAPSGRPPTEDPSDLPLMLHGIEQDTGHIDSSVVSDRIDSFRQSYQPQDRLAPGAWDDLRSSLRKSFTVPQLSEYLSRKLKEKPDVLEEGSADGSQTKLGKWRPGTSPFLETGQGRLQSVADRVAATQNIKGKDLLIERILRDCWQLGLVNDIGQLDIRLPAHLLSLLIGSEFFSFEELASLHETGIDVTHSLGLIRVTGKQRSCESVREIIHDYTNRIQSEELNLLPPGDPRTKAAAQTLSLGFLSWVEATYKVSFERGALQIPNRLYVLAENHANADNARRTLNLALNKATLPSVPFSTYKPASYVTYMKPIQVEKVAPWHDRQRLWFRWKLPHEEVRLVRNTGHLMEKHNPTLSNELLKVLRQAPATAGLGSGFEVRESITATLGKCVFAHEPSSEEIRASASQLGQMFPARTFVHEFPRATRLLRKRMPLNIDEGSRSYRIRLVPSALHANVFPTLELELVSTHGGDCDLRSAKAVLGESKVDYLLPESAADLRFTRKLTHELLTRSQKIPCLDTLLADLQGCFHKSMTSDSEVPLPVFTSITLPNNLLRLSGPEPDLDGWTTGEYMYPPVNDIQMTHVSEYDAYGQQLFYAPYESGLYGANTTADLFLEINSNDHRPSSTGVSHSAISPQLGPEEFHSFCTTACKVVSLLDPWEPEIDVSQSFGLT
ncbi:mitochondrial inner-membrane-bound regulator-domain-containing protein [Aspergillus tetrazonus]